MDESGSLLGSPALLLAACRQAPPGSLRWVCVNLSIFHPVFHHIKNHTFESYLLEIFWNCQRVGRFVLWLLIKTPWNFTFIGHLWTVVYSQMLYKPSHCGRCWQALAAGEISGLWIQDSFCRFHVLRRKGKLDNFIWLSFSSSCHLRESVQSQHFLRDHWSMGTFLWKGSCCKWLLIWMYNDVHST